MSFYKILIIGEAGTGKTSITNKIVYNTFCESYKSTIGCEFGVKILMIEGRSVRIQLWDLAGQDRGGVSRMYCREASGALVIADISEDESIKSAALWKKSVDENVVGKDGQPIPMILCLNKCDLHSRFSDDQVQSIRDESDYLKVFKTSAKDGINVNESLERLVIEILKREPVNEEPIIGGIRATAGRRLSKEYAKKKGCCS